MHQLWEPTCLINLPEQVPEIELQDLSPTGSFSSDDQEGDSGSSSPRTKKRGRSNKKRFVWSAELHMHFVRAYETLGNNATPKKVMCRMKLNGAQMDGLTRIKVASHFQVCSVNNRTHCWVSHYKIYSQKYPIFRNTN